jgi:Na+-transporting NADH:ubiquinone oxidoreductase subunit NqrB
MIFPSPVAGTAIATMGGLRVLSSSYKLYTGSTYPITSSWSRKAITASVALNLLNSDSVSSSFNNSPTWTFNHNLGSKPVLIQTYNNSFNQVLPQTIVLTNLNTATITFPVSSSGYAIATRSGLRTIPAASNLATTGSNNFKNSQTISNGYLILSYVSASLNFANDTAAGTGGVPRGGVYRNGNILQIRIT